MTSQVNWNNILDGMDNKDVCKFATGSLSGRDFYETAICKFNGVSADVRNLLRTRGVQEARVLAKKALKRRGILV